MVLQGKGFVISDISECEGGDPAAILATARSAGLSHVIVKIADGNEPYGFDTLERDRVDELVQLLRQKGLAVWGWHPVYGDDPQGEAAMAIRRVSELYLDGYVITAGQEYKSPVKADAARHFMEHIHPALTIPIALSAYRFPNYHPQFPWAAFLEKCDLHMPRVYWEQAHNVAWQLRESKRQCDALPNARPYIATGLAYSTYDGWAPTDEDATAFLDTARALNITAVNFFNWAACRKDLPLLWKAIGEYVWPVAPRAVEPVG